MTGLLHLHCSISIAIFTPTLCVYGSRYLSQQNLVAGWDGLDEESKLNLARARADVDIADQLGVPDVGDHLDNVGDFTAPAVLLTKKMRCAAESRRTLRLQEIKASRVPARGCSLDFTKRAAKAAGGNKSDWMLTAVDT